MDRWPDSWKYTEKDLQTGQGIVELFKPFVLHLGRSGKARRTIRRHIDNLWLLGGELVRRSYEDRRVRRSPLKVLLEYGKTGEAPLLHNGTEQMQDEVDVTLRALMRFMRAGRSSSDPARRSRRS